MNECSDSLEWAGKLLTDDEMEKQLVLFSDEQRSAVTNLNASNNRLRRLDWLRLVPNLTSLQLIANELESLKGISNCPGLQKLHVSNNPLFDIDELAQLPKLQKLFARECRLRNLAALAKCKSIVAVYLSGNDHLDEQFRVDSKVESRVNALLRDIQTHFVDDSAKAPKTINAVYITSGVGLRAADLNGKSDPYAKGTVFAQDGTTPIATFETQVVHKNLNPQWNVVVYFDGSTAGLIEGEVWDKDKIGKDDFLGKFEYRIPATQEKGRVNVTLHGSPLHEVKVTGHVVLEFACV